MRHDSKRNWITPDGWGTGAGLRQGELKFVFESEPLAVRHALKLVMEGLTGVTRDMRGVLELVMAEILNNVVEHAHGGAPAGVIELRLWRSGADLHCVIYDDGRPMPGGAPPPARSRDLDCPAEELPEGGFGWPMVRSLVEDLSYVRCGERNCLSFRIRGGDDGVRE